MLAFGATLAFFFRDKDRYPNFEALELGPIMGWLLLTSLVGLIAFILAHKETWRRILLRLDDPRTLAVFRIVFVCLTLFNVNGLWEHFTYLFTDEGLWPTDVAQEVKAKSQFIGFGDGVSDHEDWGFFSFAAFLQWLKGSNYSLLFFNSSPTFFWWHLGLWELSMLMLLVGFQTKWVKWIAWFGFHSITMRNTIYWEGTENIYRCWFFYLCLSRCGHAYSVDNWLRCRKLRKQGRLSEVDGPGGGAGLAPCEAHPHGLEPIYRRIPAWPRMLMILQTAILYMDTGVVKNGGVWHAGDSFYYALSLDHFYRLPPFQLGAWFGTNFFRLNTWVVHYWEASFPLVLIGMVVRFRWREKLPPLRGARLWLSRIGLVLLAGGFIGAIVYAYPVHYRQPKGSWLRIDRVQWLVGVGVPLVLAAIAWVIHRMLHRGFGVAMPLRVVVYPLRRLGAWFISRPAPDLASPFADRSRRDELLKDDSLWRLDRRTLAWILDWFFSRRFWLGLGLIFHIHLILLMNIGWFTPGAVATYICFLNGGELANLLHALQRALGRFIPAWRDTAPPPPAADLRLPKHRRDGHQLSYPVLLSGLALALIGVFYMVATDSDLWFHIGRYIEGHTRIEMPEALMAQTKGLNWGWFGGNIFVFFLAVTLAERWGRRFNPYFGPVIVLGVAACAYLHTHELLTIAASLPLTVVLVVLGSPKRRAPVEELPVDDATTGRPTVPWAYGPLGRLLAGWLVGWQLLGVGIWLLPEKDSLGTWRIRAREPFELWLRTTQTTQGWQMFAPNPPRSNLFMRVLVHDQDGEIYDLNTDVYACLEGEEGDPANEAICDAVYPIPWIWYSRQRKMNRRIVGGEGGHGSWYQKWHARWVCREWEAEHGHVPEKVELVKVTYRIAKPEEAWKNGATNPWDAYKKGNHQNSVHTERCARAPLGQIPNFVRERRGMELADEKTLRPWKKNRCRRWEKHLKDEARQRGEEIDNDDPRFRVCKEDPKKVQRDAKGKIIPKRVGFQEAPAKGNNGGKAPKPQPTKP